MTPSQNQPLRAWPYWITLTFVPLVYLAVTQGGWTVLAIPAYVWVLMPLLDIILGRNLSNLYPNTPEGALFWFRLLTWIWFPIQFVLVFGTLWYLTHIGSYSTLETLGIMFGIGVTTGTVGIVYAHELIYKPQEFERNLADLLLALVLYGHFRTEHFLVHHLYVGTLRDTVTACDNEGFLPTFLRILGTGPGSAWRAERAQPLAPVQPDLEICSVAIGVSGAGLRHWPVYFSGICCGLAIGIDQLCRALWPDPPSSGRGRV